MKYFDGDLGFIHKFENHVGTPYFPGGENSGVTLDPGVDLGQVGWSTVRKYYGNILTPDQLTDLERFRMKRGAEAKSLLQKSVIDGTPASTIEITKDQACLILPAIAGSYWKRLCRRFPRLESAPGAVQTAMLSLGYNRGTGNRKLENLKEPIEKGYWQVVGWIISLMQQDHRLRGIRIRRREEGMLILNAIKIQMAN